MIIVYGNPIPKARARVVNGHAYTPDKTLEWENTIKSCWTGPRFASGALSIRLDFYRANNMRADWDNLAKAVTDALNMVAYHDDSQIVEAHVRKFVDKDNPRVEIQLERIDG